MPAANKTQVSKKQMQNAINGYIKQGKTGNQILVALSNRKDAIGDSFRDDMAHGSSTEFAQVFNLKIDRSPVQVNQPKTPTLGDKAASYGTSALMGLSDVGAGIVQGGYYLSDKAGLTKGAYDDYNKQYQRANTETKARQKDAGRKGTDLVRTGTTIAATVPMFIAGDKTAAARGLGLLGRTAVQSGVGASVGAANYAKDGKQRKENITWGGVGGGAGELGGAALGKVAKTAATKVTRMSANKSGATMLAARDMVKQAERDTGITLSTAQRKTAIQNTAKALSKGKEQDAQAVVRKTFLDGQGIRGTQAQITRDPSVWRQEKELAKLNTSSSRALNQTHIDNHQQVAGKVQDLADSTGQSASDAQGKMTSLFDTLKQYDADQKTKIGNLYDTAQNLPESNTPINHNALLTELQSTLKANGEADKFGGMKSIIQGKLNPSGKLTLRDAEAAKKVLNRQIASTTDGSKRWALQQAKEMIDKHIDDTVMNNPAVGNARDAWVTARTAYKEHATIIDSNPALKSALDGKAPDKAFHQMIVNGNTKDIESLVTVLNQTPSGAQHIADLQGAAIDHFLTQATNANNGAFSPAQFAKSINGFGENRLNVLFTPEQITKLKDTKQVSDMVLQEPLGANVNHSNTSSALVNRVLGLVRGTSKVPVLGKPLGIAVEGVKTVGDLMKGSEAAKMLNGEVPTLVKNSLRGLTPEQLAKIGMTKDAVEGLIAAIGANTGIDTAQPTDTQPTIEAQPVDAQPSIDAPVTQGGMPQLQVGDHLAPQQTVDTMTADMPQYDIGQSAPSMPSLPPVAPQGGFEPMLSDIVPSASETPVEQPQAQPTAINAVGQTLQSLIPPPKDTADPRKMANYEQVSQQAVVSVLNTPQMHQITTELESNAPSDSKIRILQKSLSKTPEWQSFLQTLPKDQRQQLSSADVLSLITRNAGNMDAQVFTPQF